MNFEFPYQLAAFIDREPTIGEPVYHGAGGWYPQIALNLKDVEDENSKAHASLELGWD